MITATLAMFGAAIHVTANSQEAFDAAIANPPPGAGDECEWLDDCCIRFWLACRDVPSDEAVAAWARDVNERMTA